MRRFILTLGVMALASSAALADDARAVIDKAINAAGGEVALKKTESSITNETGKYYGSGAAQDYTGKYFHAPGKFRMDIADVFTTVVNGDKGWIKAGGNVTEMSAEDVKRQQMELYCSGVASLVDLKSKVYTLTSGADEKVEGTETEVVKVERKDHPLVTLFFDKKTHLLTKSTWRAYSTEESKEVDQEVRMSDYQDVGGAKMPFQMVIKREGKPFVEAKVKDVTLVDKHDDKTFDKP